MVLKEKIYTRFCIATNTNKTTNKKKILYISSPIYTVNGPPHLGHAYSTLYVDFIARYQRLQGKKVFFITGCDQHGKKMSLTAEKKGKKVEDLSQENTKSFKDLWKKLNISYTHFVETHSEKHITFVKKMFKMLRDKNSISIEQYQGFYCIPCENFLNGEKINIEGKKTICQICKRPANSFNEENFFFKTNKDDCLFLKKKLLEWKKEKIVGFKSVERLILFLLKEKIHLSISRLQEKQKSWDIVLDKDYPNQISYVWFDALWSYISILNKEEEELIWKYKDDENIQIWQSLGKEIAKFHLMYWPLFLKKANFKIPNKFLIHGLILNEEKKMSKSIGNTVYVETIVQKLETIVQKYEIDVFRLFIASLIRPQQDVKYNDKSLEDFYRSFLVNNFSNYIYRLLTMMQKYKPDFTKIEKIKIKFSKENQKWKEEMEEFTIKYNKNFKNFYIAKSLEAVVQFLDFANQKINAEKPWKLKKENKEEYLTFLLYQLLVVLKIVASCLEPFAPELSHKILQTLQLEENEEKKTKWNLTLNWKKPFLVNKVVKFFQ